MKPAPVAAVLAAVWVLATAAPGTAQTGGDDGQALFEQNCVTCHQAGGTGVPGAFPPLAGNPDVTDAERIRTVLRNGLTGPLEVFGQTYNGQMPSFPQLTDAEVEALVTYVQSLGAQAPTTAPPTTTGPGPTADAATGRRLFSGTNRLENGGPACMSCHTAGDLNHLGGSGLGPDLTTVFTRLGGRAGLTAWLTNPASPTMQPIFTTRALTATEIADLTAFLEQASTEEAGGGLDGLWIMALGGVVALFAFMALVMRRPRLNYVQRLRSNP